MVMFVASRIIVHSSAFLLKYFKIIKIKLDFLKVFNYINSVEKIDWRIKDLKLNRSGLKTAVNYRSSKCLTPRILDSDIL